MQAAPALDYFLTINNVDCTTSAWWCVNAGILRDSAPVRGEDLNLAGVHGQLPRRRWRTGRTVDLQFVFDGHADSDGEEHTDPEAGLLLNLEEFMDSVVEAEGVGGVLDVEMVTPAGTFEGTLVVDGSGLVTGPGLVTCAATLTVTLPDGRIRLTGS
jgi:hypothetical protein